MTAANSITRFELSHTNIAPVSTYSPLQLHTDRNSHTRASQPGRIQFETQGALATTSPVLGCSGLSGWNPRGLFHTLNYLTIAFTWRQADSQPTDQALAQRRDKPLLVGTLSEDSAFSGWEKRDTGQEFEF